MSEYNYQNYTGTITPHKIMDITYISNRNVSIKLEHPLAEYVDTHVIIPPQKYVNVCGQDLGYSTKSKKTGTLLLIGIVSICAIMTAVILPTPWNFMAIGFGGPITTLIKRLFKK